MGVHATGVRQARRWAICALAVAMLLLTACGAVGGGHRQSDAQIDNRLRKLEASGGLPV